MNRDEQRHRIPTSDELEQQGALAPAAGPTAERRGGLLRFFRTGAFVYLTMWRPASMWVVRSLARR